MSGAKPPSMKTNSIVLDASAILAIINREPGHEKLPVEMLAGAVASAVNLAEVQAKLVGRGWPPEEAWEDATSTIVRALPFDQRQAKISGDLVQQTRPVGLSLGDRACLTLGIILEAPVYTAESLWKKLKLDVDVRVIR